MTNEIEKAIIDAAKEFETEDHGAQFFDDDQEQIPAVLYVDKTDNEWSVYFGPDYNRENKMILWADGQEAVAIWSSALTGDAKAIAKDIADSWDAIAGDE